MIKIQKIKDWLIKESYEVNDITDKKKDRFRWHIVSSTINFEVVQPLKQEFCVIVLLLPVYDIYGHQLESLPIEQRYSVFTTITRDLLRISGIYYKITWKNERKYVFNTIQLTSDMLFFQDLTRTLFFQTVGSLRKAFVYIIEIIKEISNLEVLEDDIKPIDPIHYS